MRGWIALRRFGSFRQLAETFSRIEQERSSLAKKRIFEEYLKGTDHIDRIRKLVEYSSNSFANISDKTIHKVLLEKMSVSQKELKSKLVEQRQTLPEIVSAAYHQAAGATQVQVEQLVGIMADIENSVGKGSQVAKIDKLHELFSLCSHPKELEYMVRILQRNLRLGMTERTLFPLLDEHISDNTAPKSKQSQYAPMLARPLRRLEQAVKFAKEKRIATEIKYDGQRTNIYYNRKEAELKLISRNGKEQNESFPDLYERIKQQLEAVPDLLSAIFDAEIVAVDLSTNRPLPIQTLISRKGKSRETMSTQQVQRIMLFDMLQRNGQSLVELPYEERIEQIPCFSQTELCVPISRQYFKLPSELEELKKHFKATVEEGYEGLMLKLCGSKYDTKGGRKDWAKLKKGCSIDNQSYKSIDVDLVLMGVEQGKGKRKHLFGSYLFGALKEGRYMPVCKVGTGITQEQLHQLTAAAKDIVVPEKPEEYDVPATLTVDHWVKPSIVYEISCQDITRSPLYLIGHEPNRGGLSLRFPKFTRRRTDKNADQATTTAELIDLALQAE